MSIRVSVSILACRFTRWALRRTGRGGTALPGRVALKICPDLLSRLSKDVKSVVITGTNGKTTTTRMVAQMFGEAGLDYFSDPSGANLIYGITASFAMNASVGGKPKKEWAVIECDEATTKHVCAAVNPKVMVVTNVFSDQLDRYGDVKNTLAEIIKGVKNSPDAVICVNGDCSLCATIADEVENEIIFYGVEENLPGSDSIKVSDAPDCIKCGAEIEYDWRTFGHLGGFKCPACGYVRPETGVAVTKVLARTPDSQRAQFRIDGEIFEGDIALAGDYNLYNAAATAAVCKALDLDISAFLKAADSFSCGFGRMEKFDLGGKDGRMILVKNPAGCNQVISYLESNLDEAAFVCCLNDNEGDGRDISWIEDVEFERLATMKDKLGSIFVGGKRAEALAERLERAGFDRSAMTVFGEDYKALLDALIAQDKPVVMMPTYSAMMDLRAQIADRFGVKEFWK